MILHVTKRDKRSRKFDPKHIYDAITAAFKDSKEKYTEDDLDSLVGTVVDTISANGAKSVHVKKIQETIENTLMNRGFLDTARAYIEYRSDRDRDRSSVRQIHPKTGPTSSRSPWSLSSQPCPFPTTTKP